MIALRSSRASAPTMNSYYSHLVERRIESDNHSHRIKYYSVERNLKLYFSAEFFVLFSAERKKLLNNSRKRKLRIATFCCPVFHVGAADWLLPVIQRHLVKCGYLSFPSLKLGLLSLCWPLWPHVMRPRYVRLVFCLQCWIALVCSLLAQRRLVTALYLPRAVWLKSETSG